MPRLTKAKKAEICDNVRGGMRPGAAGEAAGFDRDFIFEKLEKDEVFAEDVERSEQEATEHVEEALYQAAVSGNVSACKMWLDLRKSPQSKALVPVDQEPDFDRELAELNNLAAGR